MGAAGADTTIKSNASMRGGRSVLHPAEDTWGPEVRQGLEQTASDAVSKRLHLEFLEATRRDRLRSRIGLAAGVVAALVLFAYAWWL